MCKTYDLYITNGRFGAGDFTFINQNGASVIDFFIVSKHLLTNTISFQVLSATESCHLPISLVIDGQCYIPRPQEDTADTITYKYHLNRDKYLRLISESILKGCFDKVDDLINISTDVDSVIDELEKGILQRSEQFKKVIKPGKSDRRSKPWYDIECKTTKAKSRKLLQIFRTSRTVNNLNKYIECKNQYKNLCKQKRQTYHKEYAAKLEQTVKDSKCFLEGNN